MRFVELKLNANDGEGALLPTLLQSEKNGTIRQMVLPLIDEVLKVHNPFWLYLEAFLIHWQKK